MSSLEPPQPVSLLRAALRPVCWVAGHDWTASPVRDPFHGVREVHWCRRCTKSLQRFEKPSE